MLIGVVLVLARPSVVRKAHPELDKSKQSKRKRTRTIEWGVDNGKYIQRNCPHYES